jgi:hypothetical protein
LQGWVINLPETVFETCAVDLAELEHCPIKLTIHTAKKIAQLEKIAKNDLSLLPPLEVAVLQNNKKYIVKGHSIFEALNRAGIRQHKANLHFVKNMLDAVILHARMSQTSPVNPLAILDLRDFLLRNGVDSCNIAKICCLDPSYEKLLSCTLSSEAKNQLALFLDSLSLKLSRVSMPSYVVEMISKKPLAFQADIVKSIFESINDDAVINDKDFVFPNPDQIRLYAEFYKKPEERNVIIFEEETIDDNKPSKHTKTKQHADISSKKKKETNAIIGNVSHVAIMDLGKKKYRIDWKNKTFAKINEKENNGFIIIRDATQLQRLCALSIEQMNFLELSEESAPRFKTIVTSKQLRMLADKIETVSRFRGILIFNKKI